MKEYPSTRKEFKINGKIHEMKKLTLGMQADIEDENIKVTYRDVIAACTNMTKEDIDAMHTDQFDPLYEDIQAFSYDLDKSEDGEPKKP